MINIMGYSDWDIETNKKEMRLKKSNIIWIKHSLVNNNLSIVVHQLWQTYATIVQDVNHKGS